MQIDTGRWIDGQEMLKVKLGGENGIREKRSLEEIKMRIRESEIS